MALLLIEKLGRKQNSKGNTISLGLYLCSFCLKEITRQLGAENRQISCGCQQYSEEWKHKISLGNKGKKRTEEQNKRNSETHKGKKLSKESIEKRTQKQKGLKRTEVQKIKYSESKKGKKNPQFGKKGILCPNWQDGSSFEPYGLEFNKQIKKSILERDNYQCQDPNCDGNHKKLHIHHIDYDKKNNNPENLITLCNSCHTRTNGKKKRQYFTEFYQNIMMGKLMECLL